MTEIGPQLTALIAVVGFAGGGLLGGDSPAQDGPPKRTALVIDAAAARDGRELVDPRLRDLDADVRLPRTAEEARTNVRYFDALGYDVVVAGPQANAAASAVGVAAESAPDLAAAVQTAAR